LAKGVPGLIVAEWPTPVVLRAGVLNFAMDQPGGDKLCRLTGVSSHMYNPFLLFQGICAPASSHVYFRPQDLRGKSLFKVDDCTALRRSPTRIAASAAEVEDAQAEGRSVANETRLQHRSGVKGYSLFFAPSPAMHTDYPHLKHLWTMGPNTAPCDTMHLVLLNVVPHLWNLFAGLKLVNKKKDEDYFLAKTTVALISRELREPLRVVPLP